MSDSVSVSAPEETDIPQVHGAPQVETDPGSQSEADATSGATPEPTTASEATPSSPWKYRIIKAIDVSGLNFLTPVVRLCYGEEPRKQLGEIVRYIVVPVLAFIAFLGTWAYLAPKHKTKSGEVPTPTVVWDAAESIWRFHTQEGAKGDAYMLTGAARELKLKKADLRLAQLGELQRITEANLAKAEEDTSAETKQKVAPLQAEYEAESEKIAAAQAKREAKLQESGAALAAGDQRADVNAYLNAVKEHVASSESEQERLQELQSEIDDVRSEKNPALAKALKQQSDVAKERQFLTALKAQLGPANREGKLEKQSERLKQTEAAFLSALGTDSAFTAAEKVVKSYERLQLTSEADYAGPWTLPWQTVRSILCVFVGFLLGTAIAIPIGILCGLSKTFMAAMTPFIALFKPVSPIVWLPIALIIVGGFIEDPDKHWLILMLADLPLIGWMKINPAFMACAITVALCSLWATMVNTAFGVASIEQDHLNVAAVLRLSFWDRLTKIIIPSALPLIFAGMRISLGVGWMVLIAAELLSSSEGIGKFIWDQFSNGASDSFAKMFVVVFLVGVVGLVLDRIMIVLQRLVTFDGAVTSV